MALLVSGCAPVAAGSVVTTEACPTGEASTAVEATAAPLEDPPAHPVTDEPETPLVYENAEYGFAFGYPREWALSEDPGGYEVAGGMASPSITLRRGTLRLHIQYKFADEMTVLGPGGRPAGEVEERSTVTFLGERVTRNALTFEGKDKSAFYGAQPNDLAFYIQLDEDAGDGAGYEEIELSEETQSDVDRILESFSWESQE
jgi:hypothetical protein